MIPELAWQPSPDFELDEENRIAIFADSNVALIAGPGTGKTEILAQRACYLLETYRCPPPRRILALTYTRAAAQNLRDRVQARCGTILAAQFDSYTIHAFAHRIVIRFGGARDLVPHWPESDNVFDDMLAQGAALLQVPIICRLYRSAYDYVFLDEFQDMKLAQYQLLRSLFLASRATITAAGDDDQRIMGWGNDLIPQSFIALCNDFDATPVTLTTNHRSTHDLQLCQRVLAKWVATGQTPEVSEHGIRSRDHIQLFDGDDEELVAHAILELIAGGLQSEHILILKRNKHSRTADSISQILAKNGVLTYDVLKYRRWNEEEIPCFIAAWLTLIFEGGASSRSRVIELVAQSLYLADDDSDAESELSSQMSELIQAARSNITPDMRGVEEISQSIESALIKLYGIRQPEVVNRMTWGSLERLDVDSEVRRSILELKELQDRCNDWLKVIRLVQGLDAVHVAHTHIVKGLEYDTTVMIDVNDAVYKDLKSTVRHEKRVAERSVIYVAATRARQRLWINTGGHELRSDGVGGFVGCLASIGVRGRSYP